MALTGKCGLDRRGSPLSSIYKTWRMLISYNYRWHLPAAPDVPQKARPISECQPLFSIDLPQLALFSWPANHNLVVGLASGSLDRVAFHHTIYAQDWEEGQARNKDKDAFELRTSAALWQQGTKWGAIPSCSWLYSVWGICDACPDRAESAWHCAICGTPHGVHSGGLPDAGPSQDALHRHALIDQLSD